MSDDWDTPVVGLTDEEIVALRASQARSARSGRGGLAERPLGSPDVVAHWACRRSRQPVAVTDGAAYVFSQSNANLRKRGERPLSTSECLLCDECTVLFKQACADKRAEQAAKVTEHIRWLKEQPAQRDGGWHPREREACDYVAKFANEGPGILAHILRKRNGGGESGSKKEKRGTV